MPSINQQLLKAAAIGDTDKIKKLMALDANMMVTDDEGCTPLHLAASGNHLSAVRLLLEYGAPLESKMNDDGTPLMNAVAMGHKDIVSCLLENGANADVVDESEWSLLHWAACEDHPALLPLLLQHSPSLINKARWNNVGPLHMAMSSAMAESLLIYGADVNQQDEDGSTPLHQAASHGHLSVVRTLVKYGANILMSDAFGHSPMDSALEKNHFEVVRFLEEIIESKKGRSPSGYDENLSMALHRHDTDFLFAPLIIEHAQRRVDLYFYLLIAYYKTNLTAHISETIDQHGRGAWISVKIKLSSLTVDDRRRVIDLKEVLFAREACDRIIMGYCDKSNQYQQVGVTDQKIIELVSRYERDGLAHDLPKVIKNKGYSLIQLDVNPAFMTVGQRRKILNNKPAYAFFHSQLYYIDRSFNITLLATANISLLQAIFAGGINVLQQASEKDLNTITSVLIDRTKAGYPKAGHTKDKDDLDTVQCYLKSSGIKMSTPDTAGCHSAILPALKDTQHSKLAHQMNTRTNPGIVQYQTGLLDGTHFQESLNATVELHKSVNYFDTHHVEKHKNQNNIRAQSLRILNDVSHGIVDPLEGLFRFLTALRLIFKEAQTPYFNNKELSTSPRATRPLIFASQQKGSFDSNWHEDSNGKGICLNQDYVNMMLKLTPQEIKCFKKQADETSAQYSIRLSRESKEIYEHAYAVIKTEMGLRADLAPTILDKKQRAMAYVSQQGFFPQAASNDEHTHSKPSYGSESPLKR